MIKNAELQGQKGIVEIVNCVTNSKNIHLYSVIFLK